MMNPFQRRVDPRGNLRYVGGLWILGVMLTCAAPGCDDASNNPRIMTSATGGSGGSSSTNTGGTTGGTASIVNPCEKSDPTLADTDAAALFGVNKIPTFDMYLPADAWERLKVNARDEIYVPAQACFEGKAVGLVGFRFKGSYGSLYNCFDAAGNNTCRKLGMKIKFDEFESGQHFYGLKHLNFHGYHYDDSYMKERLSYDLYRAMDIVAPRAAWALLRVNDDPQGLFGMVEEADGRFTKNRWPDNGDGNLFKEAWPGETNNTSILSQLKTNSSVGDISAFKAFSAAINAATDDNQRSVLGSFTDLDYWARYMAVDDAIANYDGITTYYTTTGDPAQAGNHNFYLYQEAANKFTIIPWDLEATLSTASGFGSVPYWQTTPADCSLTYLAWGGPLHVIAPGCTRIFKALAADLTSYRAAAQQLLDGAFAEDQMVAKIDAFASFIGDAAHADPHGPGATGFDSAVAFLKQDIPNLRRRLQHLLSGQPSAPLTIDVTKITDFEASDDYGLTDGTLLLCNGHSTDSVAVNTTDPIDGAKTLRISFNFGNETKTWDQWMIYRIPLVAAPKDTTSLTGIRMKIRSDQARTVRLDIISPQNAIENLNQGINLGWDLTVGTTAQVLTVKLLEAKVPSWATDPGIDLTKILQTFASLSLQPICNSRDASGQLPNGVTDNGWVDVDDIEFF
jgi:spore coat protein H